MSAILRKIFLNTIFGILLLLSGCHEKQLESKTFVAPVIKNNEKITIANNGEKDVSFNLKINGKLFISLNDIIESIDKMPNDFDDESQARKAWRLVVNNTIQLKINTSSRWIHQPLLMLNSAGFGLCDDLAAVLSLIWKKQGYPTRIWTLQGHVVPEVFIQGKWQMFDPSFAVYYLNDENKVAGVEELTLQPELISNPRFKLPPNYNRSFIQDARKYSGDVASMYQSKEDNLVSDWYEQIYEIDDFEVQLPAGAKMEFPVMTPDSIHITDAIKKLTLKCFIKYTLPENWQGTIEFPFAISHIIGKGKINLNEQPYLIGDKNLNAMLKKFDNYYRSVDFEKTEDITEVYCLLNSVIFGFNDSDTLSISGYELSRLSVQSEINKEYRSEPHINFATERKISESAWGYYNYYNSKKNFIMLPFFAKPSDELNTEDVSESIRLLIHSMDSLPLEERKRKAKILAARWETAYPILKGIKMNKKISFSADPAYFAYMLGVLENSKQ
jgi:hypothetical protein